MKELNKFSNKIFFSCIFFILPVFIWTIDFGVILDQRLSHFSSDRSADYAASLIPRFYTPLGENGDLYVSAGFYIEYANEDWNYIPELLRTEFIWYFNSADLVIGRMYYTDPLGFIAEGLFDGARLSYDTNIGTFSAGTWYTGLLFKKRANITMTNEELISYSKKLDYNDFIDSYFAPGRLVYALDWEHQGLGYRFLEQKFSLLGQYDITGNSLHSQYLIGRLSLPIQAFRFDLGGSFEFIQGSIGTRDSSGIPDSEGIQDSKDFKTAFAAEIGVEWILPTALRSRLSLLSRYSSGVSGGNNAFLPINTKTQGTIFRAKLSGITMISLDYLARLHRNLSLGFNSSYFIRSDLETYNSYPLINNTGEGHFIGNEFFGRLYWSPFSDLSMNLGGGVFLPSLGNAASGADNLWRAELNLTLSLY